MDRNDRWIARNFTSLIDLYGGRYVAVVDRRVVAVGGRPDRVERQARALTRAMTPSVLLVPKKKAIRGVFWNSPWSPLSRRSA
jgi:hypothetical protein